MSVMKIPISNFAGLTVVRVGTRHECRCRPKTWAYAYKPCTVPVIRKKEL